MYRLGLFALVPLLLLVTAAPGGDDKKQPDIKKKFQPPPPRPLIVRAEMKDGTTLQCEFQSTQTISVRAPGVIGVLTLRADTIRFIDFEGQPHPLGPPPTPSPTPHYLTTHNFESISGTVLTEEFPVRLVTTGQKLSLFRPQLTRLFFPEPIRVLTIP
ncbi:MAG: hypothetical protein IT429_19495 [Gemmataceae bacterium]|nr:hypothetical protein [Gemmataceae bacterium]